MRAVWSVIRLLLLCGGLIGLSLGLLWSFDYLQMLGEPQVDLSRPAPADEAPPVKTTTGQQSLRFSVATMVSAQATFSTYRRLVRRIGRDVRRQEIFLLRPTYAEVRRALEDQKTDVALVCTGTYLHGQAGGSVRLLAQPEFEAPLEYRCVILVPSGSSPQSLADLRGHTMAFTDPESNTGYLVPAMAVMDQGAPPQSYFHKTVFTGSHDRSILAVAMGVVDAAAVDYLIWQSKLKGDPTLADRVREVWRSPEYGPPPIVVPKGLDPKLEGALRKAFLSLHEDEEGRQILSELGIRRFVEPQPDSYSTALELWQRFQRRRPAQWP